MKKLSELDFCNEPEISFGEEKQINDYQFLLPIIINGEEISTDDINFIIEPHIVDGKDLYQPHIHIIPKLQHKGLGYKIYKEFIHEFGNIYSSHWCRTNSVEIPKIYSKLSKEPDIEIKVTNQYYYLQLKSQN